MLDNLSAKEINTMKKTTAIGERRSGVFSRNAGRQDLTQNSSLDYDP
jgi:hypothetical protein